MEDEIRNQSRIRLSTMVPVQLSPLPSSSPRTITGTCPAVAPGVGNLSPVDCHLPSQNARPRDPPPRPGWPESHTSHCTFRSARVCFAAITNADLSPSISGPFPQRTHNCGALSERDLDSTVVLSGWILPERSPSTLSSGSPAYVFVRKASRTLSFFPLKDSYGTTQLVVYRDPANVDKFAALSAVPPESVVLIQGRVRSRPVHSKRTVRFPFVIPFGSVL